MWKSTCTAGRVCALASITGLVVMLAACTPDGPVAPVPSNPTGELLSARQTGLVAIPIIPLGPSGGARATAINEAGVVAGWTANTSGAGDYAFTWKNGVMTNLGVFFEPVAINRSGAIAGNVGDEAAYWDAGVLVTLGKGGGTRSVATDLNDKGQIVGYIELGPNTTEAFIWQDGSMMDLGSLGGPQSLARAINNHGEVAGYSRLANGYFHAFVWQRGAMTDLGTLGGTSSMAFAINDRGDIAGFGDVPVAGGLERSHRLFLWRRGVMTRLLPEGDSQVDVYDIADLSDAGHLAGARMFSGSSTWRPFVWRDGVLIDLAGQDEGRAMSVNSSGEVAGYTGPWVHSATAYLWTVGRHGP